tara:strand:- start:1120 stop:1488 length:369 start_codon:yes stop_codon:yes gene_type:complete
MEDEIFISGNVPSSKNGKRWTGKYLIHSKTTMNYIQSSKEEYVKYRSKFLDMIKEKQAPYKVSFTFHRGSRRKFDYLNPAQTVQDLMVKYDWIEDDNCEFMIPSFKEYDYNKEKPGVTIKVL